MALVKPNSSAASFSSSSRIRIRGSCFFVLSALLLTVSLQFRTFVLVSTASSPDSELTTSTNTDVATDLQEGPRTTDPAANGQEDGVSSGDHASTAEAPLLSTRDGDSFHQMPIAAPLPAPVVIPALSQRHFSRSVTSFRPRRMAGRRSNRTIALVFSIAVLITNLSVSAISRMYKRLLIALGEDSRDGDAHPRGKLPLLIGLTITALGGGLYGAQMAVLLAGVSLIGLLVAYALPYLKFRLKLMLLIYVKSLLESIINSTKYRRISEKLKLIAQKRRRRVDQEQNGRDAGSS